MMPLMKKNRALALLLALAAPAALAQTVDFDGSSRLPAASAPEFPKPSQESRKPRKPKPSRPPEVPPSAPSGSVSFNGATLPARAFSRLDRIPDSLIAAIDATRAVLRLALYELDLPGVTDAIVRAKRRGVDVKLIYDMSHGGTAAGANAGGEAEGGNEPGLSSGPSAQFTQLVDAGVETRLLKGNGSGIMHNKIAIFDGELVETGSFNWSMAADQVNFENALFRDDSSLASLYASYWDWMWTYGEPAGASAPSGPREESKFGEPPVDPSPSVSYKGQSWPRASFSPGGGTEARLAGAISRCERTLDIAIFSFYSKTVADAVAAAKARGVAVRVVGDASQARRSPEIADLIGGGVPLRLSAGRGGKGVLHHKFALLDGEMLATGSFNFSQNAEKNNFENQFYTTDADDLAGYQAEFEAVWDQAHAPALGELQDADAGGVVLR